MSQEMLETQLLDTSFLNPNQFRNFLIDVNMGTFDIMSQIFIYFGKTGEG